MALASLLSARLNEPESADSLYSTLLPTRGTSLASRRPSRSSASDRRGFYLGLLATVRSRWAEATDHFQSAIAAHGQLGARSFLARTRYEYARMLLCRGAASDRTQALGLLDRALATASTLGMTAVAGGIRALQAAHAGEAAPGQSTGAEAAGGGSGNAFRREGEYWTVRYNGSVARLKDAKGLRYLARLLADPGREFHAVDLAATIRTGRYCSYTPDPRAPITWEL